MFLGIRDSGAYLRPLSLVMLPSLGQEPRTQESLLPMRLRQPGTDDVWCFQKYSLLSFLYLCRPRLLDSLGAFLLRQSTHVF